jgi:hypothetical protein
MADLYGKCGTCGRVWLVAKAGILLTTAAKLSKRAACANGCGGKVFPATADEIAAAGEEPDRLRFLRSGLHESNAELSRLRNLIAGLDPDHWGLQARVVALKEAAMKEGGA